MGNINRLLDTSDELIIQRHKGGIKLVPPPKTVRQDFFHKKGRTTVGQLSQSPINVYFMDTHSHIQRINENTVNTCGFSSTQDAIGRTIRNVAKKEAADFSINQDRNVIKANQLIISEDPFVRKEDSLNLTALTIKFPWLAENDEIIGVFGCSIIMNRFDDSYISLADALTLLTQSGLLNSSFSDGNIESLLPGLNMDGVYLSKRELECLRFLLRGKTAKDIASLLLLSPRTIEFYLDNIKRKMGVSSKSELIEKTIDHILAI